MSNDRSFSFDDVLMIPQKSDISSRDDVCLQTSVSMMNLQVPIVSSPMDTVTGHEMLYSMSIAGGLGIMHRYNTIQEQVSEIKKARTLGATNLGAAIGVTGDYLERSRALKNEGVYMFCLDVAHGHHVVMERALKKIKDSFGEEVVLIAGNVATSAGYSDLAAWGADVVRVGIGGGSICSTRIQTGHGLPTLYSVMLCSAQREFEQGDTLIMADGGIRSSGDIVKSLAFGADLVMLGSVLAGTPESPGETIVDTSGHKRKVYRGMASKEAQTDWRGSARSLEGISSTVPLKPPTQEIMQELAFNIKSGLSYTGAKNVSDFQARAKYMLQSSASQIESSTHILQGGGGRS